MTRFARQRFWLALLCFLSPASLGGATEVRVALMDFTTAENSYPAMRAAAEISALVQPLVATQPNIVWVERNQLCQMRRELELALEQLTRADALRCGKWARAERLVLGDFARHEGGDWKLDLEIVAVARAETLARSSLVFDGTAMNPLSVLLTNTARISAEINRLQAKADETAAAHEGKFVVAPLFFADRSNPREPGYGLEEALFEAIERIATTNSRLRVVNFARANLATPEVELAAAGLTDADDRAWEKSADAFVWGTYSFTNVSRGGPKMLRIALSVWNRGLMSDVADSVVFDGDLSKLGREFIHPLLSRVADLATRAQDKNQTALPGETIATAIVENFGARNDGPMRSMFLRLNSAPDPAAIRMLDLACFFDPANPAAQEERTRHRFGRSISVNEPRGKLNQKLKRFEAWGRYVERFGFHPSRETNTALRYTTIVSEYLNSAADVLRDWDLQPRFYTGFPADTPKEVEAHWKNEFLHEYARRLERAIEYLTNGPLPSLSPIEGVMSSGIFLPLVPPPELPIDPVKRSAWITAAERLRSGMKPSATNVLSPPLMPVKPVNANTNWKRQRVAPHEAADR